jgi:hypothetical protein
LDRKVIGYRSGLISESGTSKATVSVTVSSVGSDHGLGNDDWSNDLLVNGGGRVVDDGL